MNLQSRLARIEKIIDPNVCLACGVNKGQMVQVSVSREDAEAVLQRYLPYVDRATAMRMLAEDDPIAARALGSQPPYPPGCCPACGSARNGVSRERAEAALARYLPHVESRERAVELLREDDPELAALCGANQGCAVKMLDEVHLSPLGCLPHEK
jgi:hypothetical protein